MGSKFVRCCAICRSCKVIGDPWNGVEHAAVARALDRSEHRLRVVAHGFQPASNVAACAVLADAHAHQDRDAFAPELVPRIRVDRRARPWRRVRCSIKAVCCSIVLIGTNRIDGRVTASQIAAASFASFLLRLR
jgi:hypothetical protein